MRFPLAVLLLAVLAGCGGTPAPVSKGAKGDCVRAWNAAGNSANREALRADPGPWLVEATTWSVPFDLGDGSGEGPGYAAPSGCRFVFFTDDRLVTYESGWKENGDLHWDQGEPERLARSAGQEPPERNARLRADGTLVWVHTG